MTATIACSNREQIDISDLAFDHPAVNRVRASGVTGARSDHSLLASDTSSGALSQITCDRLRL
ncbi:hypothetical protein, partial [Caballeronia glathei]|uniref:hypothetical protein n=1 Tax=Caballeronia glathei TaxID=60547 RepID=UPI001E5AF2B3